MLYILLALLLSSTSVFAAVDTAIKPPAYESRVMFDEDMHWATSKEATDKILIKIKSAGFNVYVPCVWHGGGALYPTNVAPVDRRLARRIFYREEDPLAYLIQRAHEMGIEVHPWFTVMRRENDLFPKWRATGTNEEAFDVHDSDFRKFIVDLMLDVVKRYPIDGVNLDYIRSMGFCTKDSCIDGYEKKFRNSLLADIQLRRLPLYKSDTLEHWNHDDVTDVVRKFSTVAKKLRPGLIVSIDANPLNPEILLQGQDSIGWVEAGLIDVIFNMDYKKQVDVGLINRAKASLKKPSNLITMFSLYDLVDNQVVPRNPNMIAGYVTQTRRLWPKSGIAFYHYKQLTEDQASVLRSGVFNEMAIPSWATPKNQ